MQYSQNPGQSFLQYQGQYYPLNKPQVIIGSDQSCDIRIENNPNVLPMHAQVISQAGQVFIQYMKREAAIRVNGSPVAQQVLQDQDEITLGDGNTRLTLLLNRQPTGISPQFTLDGAAASGSGRLVENGGVSSSQALAGAPPRFGASQALAHPGQSAQVAAMMPSAGMAPTFGGAQTPGVFATVQQFQPSTSAAAEKATNTTRYLCAAGHLDENFQDYVMRHVVYEERRALGESYGVDMPLVVSWCKAGLTRINVRDGILTALLGFSLLGYFLLLNVPIIGIIVAGLSQPSFSLGGYSQPVPVSIPPGLLILSLVISLIATGLLLLGLVIIFHIEKWLKRRWPKLRAGFITYPLLLIILSPLTIFDAIAILLFWGTTFVELLIRYFGKPLDRLRKDTFNPQDRPAPLDESLERKLLESFSTGQRNVVAYSGFKPFAGAGLYKEGWSFVINTSQGTPLPALHTASEERLTPRPFAVGSLYEAVEKDIWNLGMNEVLEIEGKLYVQGQYLPESPAFFNASALRPVTSIDPRLVEQYKEHPTEGIRYYQCLRFNFWRGEMIFTAFLRFVLRGKDLFVEANYLLLPPMDPTYYWVDEREYTPRLNKIWDLYMRSLDTPAQVWLGAPRRLIRSYTYTRQQRKLARIARNNPAFDYGADTSLRQVASDDEYHLFFQKLDEEMYAKIVDKQILDTIVTFLAAHQIDTSEIRRRMQVILNNTTNINNGGQMAVGDNNSVNGNNSNTITG